MPAEGSNDPTTSLSAPRSNAPTTTHAAIKALSLPLYRGNALCDRHIVILLKHHFLRLPTHQVSRRSGDHAARLGRKWRPGLDQHVMCQLQQHTLSQHCGYCESWVTTTM